MEASTRQRALRQFHNGFRWVRQIWNGKRWVSGEHYRDPDPSLPENGWVWESYNQSTNSWKRTDDQTHPNEEEPQALSE